MTNDPFGREAFTHPERYNMNRSEDVYLLFSSRVGALGGGRGSPNANTYVAVNLGPVILSFLIPFPHPSRSFC